MGRTSMEMTIHVPSMNIWSRWHGEIPETGVMLWIIYQFLGLTLFVGSLEKFYPYIYCFFLSERISKNRK